MYASPSVSSSSKARSSRRLRLTYARLQPLAVAVRASHAYESRSTRLLDIAHLRQCASASAAYAAANSGEISMARLKCSIARSASSTRVVASSARACRYAR